VILSWNIEVIARANFQWLKKKHKRALYEALEKIKSGTDATAPHHVHQLNIILIDYLFIFCVLFDAELMLLGFMSLLLTVGQGTISNICISQRVGATWNPCSKEKEQELEETDSDDSNRRKLLMVSHSGETFRRFLASDSSNSTDKCVAKVCPGHHTLIRQYMMNIFIFIYYWCVFFSVKTATVISHIRHMIMFSFFFPYESRCKKNFLYSRRKQNKYETKWFE
jgi:mlo protein